MVLVKILATRVREAPDASPTFKIWGQHPVHTSLPFLPSGFSKSPTPASAEGASREDGLLCGWWCICYLSKTLTVFLIEYLDK